MFDVDIEVIKFAITSIIVFSITLVIFLYNHYKDFRGTDTPVEIIVAISIVSFLITCIAMLVIYALGPYFILFLLGAAFIIGLIYACNYVAKKLSKKMF